MGYSTGCHTTFHHRHHIVWLPKHRAAIFVYGCFWHRHEGRRNASVPKSNAVFWTEKFARNVERDSYNVANLIKTGWWVCIVWECAVRQRGEQAVGGEVADWISEGRQSVGVKIISGQTADASA